jgi:hypothetical protein
MKQRTPWLVASALLASLIMKSSIGMVRAPGTEVVQPDTLRTARVIEDTESRERQLAWLACHAQYAAAAYLLCGEGLPREPTTEALNLERLPGRMGDAWPTKR